MSDVKFRDLVVCAKELNKVVDPDPLIKTVAVSRESLEKDIYEVSSIMEPEDIISSFANEVLTNLGISHVARVDDSIKPSDEKIENSTEPVLDSIDSKTYSTPPPTPSATDESTPTIEAKTSLKKKTIEKKKTMNRTASVKEALKLSQDWLSLEEIQKKANEIYVRNGGKSSDKEPTFLRDMLALSVLTKGVDMDIREDGKIVYRLVSYSEGSDQL